MQKILITIFLLTLTSLSGCALMNNGRMCDFEGGTWSRTHKECEGITEDRCEALGGEFNECASACRYNQTEGSVCAVKCVSLCSFT